MSRRLHIDLFSGIGGFSLAADQVTTLEHEFVEYEPHLQRVLRRHWPDSKIHGDIRDYSAPKNPFLITGGFPCQDISIGNTNKNKLGIYGERSGLWAEYFRVLRDSRPKYCVIENVFALLGNGLGKIAQDLAEIGYDTTYTTLDSQFCGVPQRRRRVYILGVRDGVACGTDVFQCAERSMRATKESALRVKEKRSGVFETPVGEWEAIAYFTKQRSDEFNQSGVACTITKRDWKSNTDLILNTQGVLRGLTIEERMRLQGIPSDWLDGCGLTTKQKYAANGMTIPAVAWVIEKLLAYEYSLDI